MREINYNLLPPHMIGGMKLYIEHGIAPGGFMYAVLSNDLIGAFSKADHINRNSMYNIVTFIVNELPISCHGSREQVDRWIDNGGYIIFKEDNQND